MMLRTLVPPLWSFVLLVLFAIGPCTGTLALWLRLRIRPANAKGITAMPMMRTSLLPKVPTRALTPKINNATQSVVLNPMLPPPQAEIVSSPRCDLLRTEPLFCITHFHNANLIRQVGTEVLET